MVERLDQDMRIGVQLTARTLLAVDVEDVESDLEKNVQFRVKYRGYRRSGSCHQV